MCRGLCRGREWGPHLLLDSTNFQNFRERARQKREKFKGNTILCFVGVEMVKILSKTPVGHLHEIKISLILKGDNVSRIRDKLTRTNAEHV
jgi:hypothetical protein